MPAAAVPRVLGVLRCSERSKWILFFPEDRSINLRRSWHECLHSRQGKCNLKEGKRKTIVFSLLNFWRPAKQPVCLHWLDWLTSFWARDDGNRQTHPCIWNRVPRTQRENACFTQCCTKCPKQLQAYTFLGHPKFQQCQVTMNSFRIMAVMEIVVAVVKTPNSCMEKTWYRPTAQTQTMADLLFCLLWIS